MIAKALVANAVTTGITVLSDCTAHADPPTFPNLGSYAPVNASDFALDTTSPGIPSSQVFFITPDGLPCIFLSGTAGCTGDNLPGVSEKDKSLYTYVGTAGGIHGAGSTPYVNNTVPGQPIKTLPPSIRSPLTERPVVSTIQELQRARTRKGAASFCRQRGRVGCPRCE